MQTLASQFRDALKKVNLGDRVASAKAAHEEVRDHLAADPVLQGYGVETILNGSYGRDVAIWPGHDVDVFVKLAEFEKDPESLYEAVKAPLEAKYGDRLDDSGAHALAISFGDDFSVDAVCAANSTSGHWVLPSLDDGGGRTQ
jgi:tRNA nucleotidyltransferase (CCA-adding enzyme)